MAQSKSKENKLKRLENQFNKHQAQPEKRYTTVIIDKGTDEERAEISPILTRKGRIQNEITRLKRTR